MLYDRRTKKTGLVTMLFVIEDQFQYIPKSTEHSYSNMDGFQARWRSPVNNALAQSLSHPLINLNCNYHPPERLMITVQDAGSTSIGTQSMYSHPSILTSTPSISVSTPPSPSTPFLVLPHPNHSS